MLERRRDVGALLAQRRRRRREVLHRDLDRAVAGERNLPGEHLVEDDPERVQIGALVDLRAARLLRREVLRGADDRALLGHLARAGARDAEVRHLHVTLGSTSTLCGLMSRWTMPLRCAKRSAERIWRA